MSALVMLRSVADFQQIQAQSRSRVHPLVLLRYRRNDLPETRYGISTGRRIGSAVVRNKVRRRLRTILRELNGQIEPGWDLLLVARAGAAAASQEELRQSVERVIGGAGLIAKTGLD